MVSVVIALGLVATDQFAEGTERSPPSDSLSSNDNEEAKQQLPDTITVHGVELALIPRGDFEMGSAPNDKRADSDERPQHPVTLASFHLAKTPVTNANTSCTSTRNLRPRSQSDGSTRNTTSRTNQSVRLARTLAGDGELINVTLGRDGELLDVEPHSCDSSSDRSWSVATRRRMSGARLKNARRRGLV